MIDTATAIAAIDLLLSEPQEPELFIAGAPTATALRLYAEQALSAAAKERVGAALEDPVQARRLERIATDAAAREFALLRELAGTPVDTGIVVVRARASAMRRLCGHSASVAASACGGVTQTSDSEDLVTLKVAEIFEPSADDGELEVEVQTFDDSRLVNATATLHVTADDRLLREYSFELCDRHFEGRFGIRKLPHDSSSVEFRLYLCARRDGR